MALPLNGTPSSDFSSKTVNDILYTSLLMILSTQIGERVMVPQFGSNLSTLLFDPADTTSIQELRCAVVGAVQTWDDRIAIDQNSINITVGPGGDMYFNASITNIYNPAAPGVPIAINLTTMGIQYAGSTTLV